MLTAPFTVKSTLIMMKALPPPHHALRKQCPGTLDSSPHTVSNGSSAQRGSHLKPQWPQLGSEVRVSDDAVTAVVSPAGQLGDRHREPQRAQEEPRVPHLSCRLMSPPYTWSLPNTGYLWGSPGARGSMPDLCGTHFRKVMVPQGLGVSPHLSRHKSIPVLCHQPRGHPQTTPPNTSAPDCACPAPISTLPALLGELEPGG